MEDVYSYSAPGEQQPAQPPRQPANPRQQPPQKRRKKKKKGRFFKTLLALFLVLVLAAGGIFAYVYRLFGSVNYNAEENQPNVYVNESELYADSRVTNILLVGVDRRNANEASRSDTMMLFSIDKNNKTFKLTSFARDMWLYIPGKFEAKLNASCTYGGAQLVIDTIEYNFNVSIDKFVLVDFDMFMQVIDTLGGVTVPVTKAEAASIKHYGKIDVPVGDAVKLDGYAALWYSRIRKLDSDFERTRRQRNVVNSLIDNAKSLGPVKLLQLAKDILPQVETDLSASDLTSLALSLSTSYFQYDVEQLGVPVKNTWSYGTKSGQSVVLADLSKNTEAIRAFLYDAKQEDTTD